MGSVFALLFCLSSWRPLLCDHSLDGAMSVFELQRPPRANTHTIPHLHPLLFVLPSFPSVCVSRSLFACFIEMAPQGQRRCWSKSKHTSLGQYWLFLCPRLSLSRSRHLVLSQNTSNRCNLMTFVVGIKSRSHIRQIKQIQILIILGKILCLLDIIKTFKGWCYFICKIFLSNMSL